MRMQGTMKSIHHIYKCGSLLLGLSFMMNLALQGQPALPGLTSPVLPADSGEKIRLFTDRNIYLVNERIRFTAFYSGIEELKAISWSTVLYVELIRWNGARIAGLKLRLEDQEITASLEIPGNLPSGNYYLRAYTRWMRNYPPDEYACTGLKIVNPYRSETDEGPGGSEAVPVVSLGFTHRSLSEGITVVTDKKEYSRGERAEVMIGIDSKQLSEDSRFYISVTRAGTTDTTDSYIEASPRSVGDSPAYVEYLPEIRGITVSGTVTDRSEGLPLKNVPVSLSETQSGEFFAVSTTDDRGRFVFSLPDMSHQHDFFVQTETPSVIRIDNDYCNRPVRLPYIAFGLNRAETDFVREVMINQQLSERFRKEKDLMKDTAGLKSSPQVFYGSRKSVYYIDKYIELPDIKEFIFEIVLEAGIVNDKEKNSVISLRRAVNGYFPPLILLDNIRIDGNDQFLKIPLNRIERVEVINSDYLAGNERYYGIMSFYSENQDFAGMDLNRNSLFFSYDLFSEISPDTDPGRESEDPRTPDLRYQLYWNPDLQLPASGNAELSFTTSDCAGDYVVFVRSKNHSGQEGIYGMWQFTVR
jgi:hypothetical protein